MGLIWFLEWVQLGWYESYRWILVLWLLWLIIGLVTQVESEYEWLTKSHKPGYKLYHGLIWWSVFNPFGFLFCQGYGSWVLVVYFANTWFGVSRTLDNIGSKGYGLGHEWCIPLVLEGTTGMDSRTYLTRFLGV